MTCPFHDSDDSDSQGYSETTEEPTADRDRERSSDRDRGVERRSFLKSALAIGGAAALNTTIGLAGMPDGAAAEGSPVGIAERLNRQHAWDDYELEDPDKGTLPPARHVLLMLEYQGDGAPSDAHRRQAQKAFRELESTIEWDHEGLLFTIGYSPAYFERFDEPLPPGIEPAGSVEDFEKQTLIEADSLIDLPGVTLPHEDPVPESDGDDGPTYDACLHLASEHEQNILAAEELLWGGSVEVDGEEESLDHTLEGVFDRPTEYPDRRVGFAGTKNLREEGNAGEEGGVYPEEVPVDDGAKLSMGFNDLFKNSIPREDLVTLLEDQQLVEPKPPGVFAQGTVQHVSKLDLNLDPEGDDPGFGDTSADTVADDGWYEYDDQERIGRMFSPDHDKGEMGVVGQNLGSSNAPYQSKEGSKAVRDLSADDPDVAERTESDANDEDGPGVVGHVQKCARARFDMETRITDDGRQRLSDGEGLLPADERDDDFLRGHDDDQDAEQVMLRRDFNTVDRERPGLHFVSLMRFSPYMAYMRQAMNGVEFDSANFGLTGDARIQHGQLDVYDENPANNGIAGFCKTQRRGNYLIPPLTQRALPHPQGEEVGISVERAGENYKVTVDGVSAKDLEDVRFGWFYGVNCGDGAEPRGNPGQGAESKGKQKGKRNGNRTTFVFPADETGIDAAPGGPNGNVRVRFFAKRGDTGRPVRGTELTNEPTVFSQGSGVKSIGSVSNIVADETDRDVAAVGPVTAEFNGSGRKELPYLTGPDEIRIGDETRIDLGDNTAKTQKTRLGVGSWDGSETSIFYVGSDGSTIYRVTPDGSPVELATPDNGVSAAVSPADIDGDGEAELPFVDGSQQLRYIKTGDDSEQTFTKVPNGGVGANNNVGVGDPADLDLGDDETAKVPIVDGSNQIRLVDSDGIDTTVISGSDDEQAAKAPLAARDVDRDGSRELVYLENNNSPAELKYVDDVGGANEFKLLRDSSGSRIKADTDIGVV